MQVLDYSAGLPGARAIKSAGYAGAVRYIGFPDRRKCTTRNELNDFDANDLGMALVYEDKATDWQGGAQQGQAAGRRARDHANAIGFPADRPIYMAVDQDVVSAGQFATMIEYLRGASLSLSGSALTGVYGEADVIDRAREAHVASYFWQTAAWSRGRRTSAHLFQRIGTVNVGGIGCDINDVLQEDWGQHINLEEEMATAQEVADAVMANLYAARFEGGRNIFDLGVETLRQTFAVKAGVSELTDDEVKVLAAVSGAKGELLVALANERTNVQLTPEQVTSLLNMFGPATRQAMREVLGSLDNGQS